jgi:hypothetical protein
MRQNPWGLQKIMSKQIIIFGYGYVSKFLIQQLRDLNWTIYCTSRKINLEKPVKDGNVTVINFLDPKLPSIIKSSNICLSAVPPGAEIIDPVLKIYSDIISKGSFEWIGYLSSTSVYGDHKGAWVNEDTECKPGNEKSKIRFSAEQQWLNLYLTYKLPVHILRLSGIYGPNRNCLEQIKNGKSFTIIKKSQYFSRVHVTDICTISSKLIVFVKSVSTNLPSWAPRKHILKGNKCLLTINCNLDKRLLLYTMRVAP